MIAGCSCDLAVGTETPCTKGRAGGFKVMSALIAYIKEQLSHQKNGRLYSCPGGELCDSFWQINLGPGFPLEGK